MFYTEKNIKKKTLNYQINCDLTKSETCKKSKFKYNTLKYN